MDLHQNCNQSFKPTASLDSLKRRAKLIHDIRSFFVERDFLEVETPLLSHDIVVDRHIHPIGLPKQEVTGTGSNSDRRLWLQTSPEFAMKRLIAAGIPAIFQICKAFRKGESGSRHNPEFTMLEWYRTGDDLQTGMELLADFAKATLRKASVERMTYREAFQKFAKIDPFTASVRELSEVIQRNGIETETFDHEAHRDGCLNLLLSEVVEPNLGLKQPLIVYDWPASQSALSIVRQDEEFEFAERFELYVDGLELANGYHELLDANELRHRNSINNQQRLKDGNDLLPENSLLLEAMESGMPGCAGVALGVDRLAMLLTDSKSISDVIAFPLERA